MRIKSFKKFNLWKILATNHDSRFTIHGFTLLELLLAIGISALVLVSVYSSLHLGWMSYQRLDGQIQNYQNLSSSFYRLGQDLRNSFLFKASDDKNVVFSGTQKEMSFATVVRSRNKEGLSFIEVARVFYKFEDRNLLRACIKGKALLNPDPKPEYEVFLTDLINFAFSYAIKESRESLSLSWKDSWTDKTVFPQAVRLQLTRQHNGLPAIALTKSIQLVETQ